MSRASSATDAPVDNSAHHVLPAVGTLKGELLSVLARPVGRNALFSLLVPALMGMVVAPHVSWTWLALWLTAVGAGQAARWRLLPRLPTDDAARQARHIRLVTALSAANGLIHALPVVLFPVFDQTERAVTTILLCGLASAAMTVSMGYLPIYIAYMGSILGALAAAWWWSPGAADPHLLVEALPVLLALYAGMLTIGARQMFHVFRESFAIRSQHVALNRRLRTALEQAEAASRAKTRFLASASHDLRQPIHTLSLFSAALSMRPLDERTGAIAGHLETAVGTLANQLDALLDVSRLDAGIVERRIEPVALRPMLERLHAEFRPQCAERGLELRLSCEDEVTLRTDGLLLERILRNLLSNAIKYTDRGAVTLSLQAEGERAQVTVRDTGRGIPVGEQEHIFEEFYQLDNPERDRSKGLGLGLAIVHRLAAMLAIDLHLRSEVGEGTRFGLSIPDIDAPAAGAVEPAPAAEHPLTTDGEGLRVLVVDDEAAVRTGMRTLLDSMGFEVHLADSSRGAAEVAHAHPPDVVLADFRLRGDDDGLRAIQAVRETCPDVPALLISGDTAPDRLREAHRAGLDLLHKPLAGDQLRSAILRASGRG